MATDRHPDSYHVGVLMMSKGCQLRRLIEQRGLDCFWCGRKCDPSLRSDADLYPTKEHIIRKADGGSSKMHNLTVACRYCNTTRHKPGWKPPPKNEPEGTANKDRNGSGADNNS